MRIDSGIGRIILILVIVWAADSSGASGSGDESGHEFATTDVVLLTNSGAVVVSATAQTQTQQQTDGADGIAERWGSRNDGSLVGSPRRQWLRTGYVLVP